MRAIKILFKLALLLIIGATIAGAVMMIRRPKESTPVSFEQWPDVPHKTAA